MDRPQWWVEVEAQVSTIMSESAQLAQQQFTECRARSSARTQCTAATSQSKASLLVPRAAFHPSGLPKWLAYMALALPIWAGSAVGLGIKFLRNPSYFMRKEVRSLPDVGVVQGLREDFIEANGIRWHVVRASEGQGKPLMLMLHGWPECWYSFRHQIQAFMGDYEIAAIDLKGYGQTDKPKGLDAYRLDQLAADVPEIVAALGHRTCTLVGHDWGGVISWQVAYQCPDLLERLVIISAPHPAAFTLNMDLNQAARSSYMLLFQAPRLPELLLSHCDFGLMDQLFVWGFAAPRRQGSVTREECDRYYKATIGQPGAATASLNYYRAVFQSLTVRPSPTGRLMSKETPCKVSTLLIWAMDDAALGPQLLNGLEDFMADMEIVRLEDCSHWAQQDRPEEVNRAMQRFLSGKQKDRVL